MAARAERSDLAPRVLAAIPAIVFAVFIVVQGELFLAGGLILLSVVALSELYTLMRRVRPIDIAGFLAVIALILAAHYGEQRHTLIVLVCAFPVTFLFSFLRVRMQNVAWAVAATLFGVLWIGLPMTHAVFLRDLPHGDGLLIDVLVATFIGDTAAYFVGRRLGRTPLAPDISPNKTLEGLVGGFLGGTIAFWCAGLYQDWLSGADALVIGALVALVAPVGDLFESMIKRDLEV
jgi:phosphatidate cytidylyltransferase